MSARTYYSTYDRVPCTNDELALVREHHAPPQTVKPVGRSWETFPSAAATARLRVTGDGWQRFGRTLATELWVTLEIDDPTDYRIRERPAFALGAPSRFAPKDEIERRVTRAVARFNRDIEKAEKLAKLTKPRLRDRLRLRYDWR